jgi:hypothetical protein
VGDVAKETKALYCTKLNSVNEEARWTESLLSYPERSDNLTGDVSSEIFSGKHLQRCNLGLSEVSRGHSTHEARETVVRKG